MAKTTLLYIATQNPDKHGHHRGRVRLGHRRAVGAEDGRSRRATPRISRCRTTASTYTCATRARPAASARSRSTTKTGALRLLNYKESKGRGPSYVSVDGSGKYVLDANYGGGFVEVYSLAKDGSLDQQTAFVQHIGSSVHPQRQIEAVRALVPHGSDQQVWPGRGSRHGPGGHLQVRRTRPASSRRNDPPFTKVAGGMGPRHLAFHPNGKWVYGIAELANEVMAFNWDASKGALTQFQSVKTLADGFKDPSTAAEIAVRADGKFLYASNRGEDSIVVYAHRSRRRGELTFKQRVPSRGKVPRYFTFDPTNKWFIVSNQEGGNVAGVQRGREDGRAGTEG